MSLDLGSPVLDVAFGLSFVFFLLSVVASALGEGVAWITKQRSKQLEEGLRGMLGDSEVADKIYEHPLVRPNLKPAAKTKKPEESDQAEGPLERLKGRWQEKKRERRRPSYVSPPNFALALTQTLKEVEVGTEGAVDYGGGAVKQIDESFRKLDPELRKQLEPLWHEVGKDIDKFRTRAEKWFDDQMDRVAGWYKRWSQVVTIVIAVVVAVGLNASAVRITDRLYNDQAVRSAVVAGAGAEKSGTPKSSGESAEGAVKNLEKLKLPIFWAKPNLPWEADGWGVAETILGWIITAVAISLGAPFWFDALGKISKLRTSGAKPDTGAPPKPT